MSRSLSFAFWLSITRLPRGGSHITGNAAHGRVGALRMTGCLLSTSSSSYILQHEHDMNMKHEHEHEHEHEHVHVSKQGASYMDRDTAASAQRHVYRT